MEQDAGSETMWENLAAHPLTRSQSPRAGTGLPGCISAPAQPLRGGSPETACTFLGGGGYSGGAWKDDSVRGPKLELLLVALCGPIRSPVRASVFLSIKWEWWRVSSPLAHNYVIVRPGEGG